MLRYLTILSLVAYINTFTNCSVVLADDTNLLNAIHQVEASGSLTPPDGDNGKAIGPYQIHKVYWLDAVERTPSLRTAGYQACRGIVYARRIVLSYWARYATGLNQEQKARIHNGGPKGHHRSSTLPYWHKVKSHL